MKHACGVEIKRKLGTVHATLNQTDLCKAFLISAQQAICHRGDTKLSMNTTYEVRVAILPKKKKKSVHQQGTCS